MGADFGSHQCFAGAKDVEQLRERISDIIVVHMSRNRWILCPDEAEGGRSIVVGPPERWIFVGDSAGSTDTFDGQAFDALSLELSREAPVVDIQVSDSAAMHLLLYREGKLVDKYGDMEFPFYTFADAEKAAEYRGHASEWADLLLAPFQAEELQRLWVQRTEDATYLGCPEERLHAIADMLGMSPTLSQIGYTFDDEGLGEKYSEYLRRAAEDMDLDGFQELHFTRVR